MSNAFLRVVIHYSVPVVVRYAKEHSVDETAKKFRIHRKSVHKSKKKENCLNAVQRKHATTVHSLDIGKYLPTS